MADWKDRYTNKYPIRAAFSAKSSWKPISEISIQFSILEKGKSSHEIFVNSSSSTTNTFNLRDDYRFLCFRKLSQPRSYTKHANPSSLIYFKKFTHSNCNDIYKIAFNSNKNSVLLRFFKLISFKNI